MVQRLLETFRSDPGGLRDYCASDERWRAAVAFLDEGRGNSDSNDDSSARDGWHLLTVITSLDCFKAGLTNCQTV